MIKPIKKIEMNISDWIIETTTALIVIVGLIYVAIKFGTLPETIPIHFGINGCPDEFGSKYILFFLLFVGIGTYVLLTLSYRYPNLINYPFQITVKSEEAHFKNAFLMIRVLNLMTTILLGSLVFGIFQTATGQASGLGYLTPVITVLLLLSLGVFIYKGYRIKKRFA